MNASWRTLGPRPPDFLVHRNKMSRMRSHVTLNSRRVQLYCKISNIYPQCQMSRFLDWSPVVCDVFNVIHLGRQAFCNNDDKCVCVCVFCFVFFFAFIGRKVWPLRRWEKAAQRARWELGHQAHVGGERTNTLMFFLRSTQGLQLNFCQSYALFVTLIL